LGKNITGIIKNLRRAIIIATIYYSLTIYLLSAGQAVVKKEFGKKDDCLPFFLVLIEKGKRPYGAAFKLTAI